MQSRNKIYIITREFSIFYGYTLRYDKKELGENTGEKFIETHNNKFKKIRETVAPSLTVTGSMRCMFRVSVLERFIQ